MTMTTVIHTIAIIGITKQSTIDTESATRKAISLATITAMLATSVTAITQRNGRAGNTAEDNNSTLVISQTTNNLQIDML